MGRRTLLIGCISSLAIVIVVIGIASYLIHRRYANIFSFYKVEAPKQLQEPRIIIGNNFLHKSVFVELKDLGGIRSLAYGELDASPGLEVGIVGQMGALFVEERGNPKSSVRFSPQPESLMGLKVPGTIRRFGPIQVVDVNGDGVCEFFVRGGFNKAELIDHTGKTIWSYSEGDGRDSFLENMIAGDIDGDGTTEYVAAYRGGKGLVLLDSSLKERWSKPDVTANVVELVDPDGTGKLKILHDDRGRIVLRSPDGEIISEGQSGHHIAYFSLVRWPSKQSSQYALHFSDDVIRFFDFNGETVAQLSAPLSNVLHRVHGVSVRLKPNEPEYFAAVAEYSVFDRSVLYVYDGKGKLVYQEVIGQDCQSIEAIPSDKTGCESILLGGEGEVLQYRVSVALR